MDKAPVFLRQLKTKFAPKNQTDAILNVGIINHILYSQQWQFNWDKILLKCHSLSNRRTKVLDKTANLVLKTREKHITESYNTFKNKILFSPSHSHITFHTLRFNNPAQSRIFSDFNFFGSKYCKLVTQCFVYSDHDRRQRKDKYMFTKLYSLICHWNQSKSCHVLAMYTSQRKLV